jgi:hypothetical protein
MAALTPLMFLMRPKVMVTRPAGAVEMAPEMAAGVTAAGIDLPAAAGFGRTAFA